MNGYCELSCGTAVDYDEIKFSDGFILRIAREHDHEIHQCPMIKQYHTLFSNLVNCYYSNDKTQRNIFGEKFTYDDLLGGTKFYMKIDSTGLEKKYTPRENEFMNDLNFNPIILPTNYPENQKFLFTTKVQEYAYQTCNNLLELLWSKDSIALHYGELLSDWTGSDETIAFCVYQITGFLTLFENIKSILRKIPISPDCIGYHHDSYESDLDSFFEFLKYYYTNIHQNQTDKKNIYALEKEFEENKLKFLENQIKNDDTKNKIEISKKLIKEANDFLSNYIEDDHEIDKNENKSTSKSIPQITPKSVRNYLLDEFEPKLKKYLTEQLTKYESKIHKLIPKIKEDFERLTETSDRKSLKTFDVTFLSHCSFEDLLQIIRIIGFLKPANKDGECRRCKKLWKKGERIYHKNSYQMVCKYENCAKESMIIDAQLNDILKIQDGLERIKHFRNEHSHVQKSVNMHEQDFNDRIDIAESHIVQGYIDIIELVINREKENQKFK